MKFHDGSPITSADVKATYDRHAHPAAGRGLDPQGDVSPISHDRDADPLTVVFKLKNVNAALLEHLASPCNCIYTAKNLEKDPHWPETNIIGTGPFTFVEHVKGSHVVGKKNSNYWDKGMPYLDGFKGVFVLQAATMLVSLQGGQVQAEFRSISEPEATAHSDHRHRASDRHSARGQRRHFTATPGSTTLMRIVTIGGLSIPSFWLGMLIMLSLLALQLAAADHVHAVLRRPDRQSHAADLAGAVGRLPLLRGGRPHDALLAARGAARGLYPHRARQGRATRNWSSRRHALRNALLPADHRHRA